MPRTKKSPVVKNMMLKVVESFDADLERWKALVQAARDELTAGSVLYTTLPRKTLQEHGMDVVSFLKDLFAEVGPLNVGTNPHLTNNDTRARGGFLCVR